ncbi:MAG: hypothetical protein NXH97_16025 [Rhodobacteraceae bacterium]|nr:hypothetical protein [Paracoccaceae bacterium]
MTRFVPTESYTRDASKLPPAQPPSLQIRTQTPRPLRVVDRPDGGHAPLTLQLGATFAALDANGKPIALSQKKGRLMLAMLACAPGMKRSRDWLRRHLWHRSFTAHGFSSLRQCLHNLRHALGAQGVCLCADRDYIWLEATAVDWGESKDDPTLFLENAPRLDGPTQDWLDRERVRLGSVRPCAVQHAQ